jgi:hypothetical protein
MELLLIILIIILHYFININNLFYIFDFKILH